MTAIISLLFWLAVVPFCIGLIPANFISAKKRSPGFVLLSGYFGMWAIFEVAAVPAVLWVEYDNFKAASVVFTVLTLLSAAAGIVLLYRNGITVELGQFSVKRLLSGEGIEWLVFFVLLGLQLYKAAAFSSFDGDDAYYVVESLIAQEAGVMYRILPLTGGSTGLDVRHAMAVFPMWIAFISVRAGIHATIVSHVVMPLVLIPLTYLLYYEIGRILFVKFPQSGGRQAGMDGALRPGGKRDGAEESGRHVFHRENLPVFMIIMAMFQIFGNVSIYTGETFFLTRTWQGKALVGALVIPAIFWVFLQIYNKGVRNGRTDAGLWILLVCINMTAGVCSSIAVFLVCILIAVATFCLAVAERDWKVLFKVGAACIPNVVYMAVYVVMAYSYLL